MKITKKTRLLAAEPRITQLFIYGTPVEKLTPGCDFYAQGKHLSAFNAETGDSTATIVFTAGSRAGQTLTMPYTSTSCSPRYDEGCGIFIAQPNVDLVAGEKGTVSVTIDGKTSNAFPFEVAEE